MLPFIAFCCSATVTAKQKCCSIPADWGRQTLDVFAEPIQSLARSATPKLKLDEALGLGSDLLLGFYVRRLAAEKRKQNDITNAAGIGKQHHESVNADSQATGRGHAVLE